MGAETIAGVALRAAVTAAAALLLAGAGPSAGRAAAQGLPAEIEAALQRARVPAEALGLVVQEIGARTPMVAHRAAVPMNPASVVKLLPSAVALDQLGPAWTWSTPVWLAGRTDANGVLDGSLHIKGGGDPKLVQERLWLLLRRVQQLGVREIRGDIVLDGSAFAVADGTPADFDGEATRPYNARPGALLLNYRAVIYTFTPDAAAGVARIGVEPPLAGFTVDRTVPLSTGPCDDWAGGLKATFGPPRTRFAGSYPAACGEQVWPLADAQPATYDRRLIEGLWREMGGRLGGTVREGPAPAEQKPTFELRSPPLVEVVREINKFSNNVMAQQLTYTLALQRQPERAATAEAARDVLRRWWAERIGEWPADAVIDNGSGLSRETRLSPQMLARLLQVAWESPWMPELMSALPIAGMDGTLRRSRAGGAGGRAHLKTGSLRDVAARAGYVLSASGRRYVVVAIVNHPAARDTRPLLDALVQWVLRDAPPAR
ncbi:MAG: D-alanyl-D-alanine carboxypeptidase/D-alanyl-D-alanine-endopeptidase [Rubrivivax sp.]|nr:D-alanyl-D-alanine carboxypeptidase/D-alanyl-D-alanine-endopeptidase [Rubrivivax sp.]